MLPGGGFAAGDAAQYMRQRYSPGLWWSSTTGGHVGYESWLERDHLMLLDFDPAVVRIASQPSWLFWDDEASGRRRSHPRDYFAWLADGRTDGRTWSPTRSRSAWMV